jgi:preprotein translocase subunit SecG
LSTVLLIVHLFVTLALIGVVLIQRSEGGGLGIGSSQGMGSFMSGRGTANLLTRATAILATIFMALALALALLNHGTSGVGGSSILGPLTGPASSAPALPGAPSGGPLTGSPAPGGPAAGGTAPGGAPGATAPAKPATPPPPSGPSVPTN